MNNLGQCAKAVHNAYDHYKAFPPLFGIYGPPESRSLSFHTHLLPYVDYGDLFGQKTPNGDAIVLPYLSPMDPTQTASGAGAANYAVNVRLYYTDGGLGTLGTADQIVQPKLTEMKDGTSNTLLFATKYHHCGVNGGSMWADSNAIDSPTGATFGRSMALWQAAPMQQACNPNVGTAVSLTPDFIQVALCDGSFRSVSVRVSQATWQAVHTPSAGDTISADWDD
jgi:hypothetical protein